MVHSRVSLAIRLTVFVISCSPMNCWDLLGDCWRLWSWLCLHCVDVDAASFTVVESRKAIRVAAASWPMELQTLGKQRVVEVGGDATVARAGVARQSADVDTCDAGQMNLHIGVSEFIRNSRPSSIFRMPSKVTSSSSRNTSKPLVSDAQLTFSLLLDQNNQAL